MSVDWTLLIHPLWMLLAIGLGGWLLVREALAQARSVLRLRKADDSTTAVNQDQDQDQDEKYAPSLLGAGLYALVLATGAAGGFAMTLHHDLGRESPQWARKIRKADHNRPASPFRSEDATAEEKYRAPITGASAELRDSLRLHAIGAVGALFFGVTLAAAAWMHRRSPSPQLRAAYALTLIAAFLTTSVFQLSEGLSLLRRLGANWLTSLW